MYLPGHHMPLLIEVYLKKFKDILNVLNSSSKCPSNISGCGTDNIKSSASIVGVGIRKCALLQTLISKSIGIHTGRAMLCWQSASIPYNHDYPHAISDWNISNHEHEHVCVLMNRRRTHRVTIRTWTWYRTYVKILIIMLSMWQLFPIFNYIASYSYQLKLYLIPIKPEAQFELTISDLYLISFPRGKEKVRVVKSLRHPSTGIT